MTQSNILFIGMDVHKDSMEIASAEEGTGGEVRRFGAIGGTKDAFKKALRKLVFRGRTLHFCYETGPTGYELYRYIKSEGHECVVVAPSLIPKCRVLSKQLLLQTHGKYHYFGPHQLV